MDHLYLFACGLSWNKYGDLRAGWELIAGLQSYDPDLRQLSMEMLARRPASAQQLLCDALEYGILLPEDCWHVFHAFATSSLASRHLAPLRVDNRRLPDELTIRPTGHR